MGAWISVIVPLLNEEGNIRPLHDELLAVLEPLGAFEILYIDDGSTDSSPAILRELSEASHFVKVIRLRRNFGQTAALAAGTDASEGEIVIYMDGDRQNDPADIPRLVAKIEEGFDVVSGWRRRRKDRFLSRRLPSILANRLISSFTGVHLHDYGCTLKAYRRDVIENVRLYGEMHRLIPVLASWVGASLCEIQVNHRPRTAGVSKYGIGRTGKVLLDLLTVKFLSGYSTKPIYVFGGAGFITGLAAVAAAVFTMYQKLANGVFVHRNPVFTIAVFLGFLATQFVLLGLIAELATRTYHESQDKPIYVIRESMNLTPARKGRAAKALGS